MNIKKLKKLSIGMGCTVEDYLFLYGFVSLLKPKNIVEIGTNVGIGSIVMGYALKDNNIDGKIYTFDIIEKCSIKARKQSKSVNINNYINFFVGSSDNVKNLWQKTFDIGYIDGEHTYEGVKKDFKNLKDICDYLIFHDSDACGGVRRFTNELEGEKIKITNRPFGALWTGGLNTYFNGITLWRKTDE